MSQAMVTHLSGSAVCGIGAVVELSVQLPGVKVQNKLPQFAFHTGKTTHSDIFIRREGIKTVRVTVYFFIYYYFNLGW